MYIMTLNMVSPNDVRSPYTYISNTYIHIGREGGKGERERTDPLLPRRERERGEGGREGGRGRTSSSPGGGECVNVKKGKNLPFSGTGAGHGV